MDQSHSGDQSWLQENGTTKVDRVVLKELAFWLPHTKEHLCDGILLSYFDSLVKFHVAQIQFILGIVITIMRKNSKFGGIRLANCSLKLKVDAWQRIIDIRHACTILVIRFFTL